MKTNNLISEAIELVGLAKLAKLCAKGNKKSSLTYQAILKWKNQGRMPFTEHAGQTTYCDIIQKATKGKVKKEDLLKMGLNK